MRGAALPRFSPDWCSWDARRLRPPRRTFRAVGVLVCSRDVDVGGALDPVVLGDVTAGPLLQRPPTCSVATACAAVCGLTASSAANTAPLEAVADETARSSLEAAHSELPSTGGERDAATTEPGGTAGAAALLVIEEERGATTPCPREAVGSSADTVPAKLPSVGGERNAAPSVPGGATGAVTGVASAEQPTWGGERRAAPP